MVSAYHHRRHRLCRRFLFFARIFARVNYNKHAFIIAGTTTTTTTVALTWARSRPDAAAGMYHRQNFCSSQKSQGKQKFCQTHCGKRKLKCPKCPRRAFAGFLRVAQSGDQKFVLI